MRIVSITTKKEIRDRERQRGRVAERVGASGRAARARFPVCFLLIVAFVGHHRNTR